MFLVCIFFILALTNPEPPLIQGFFRSRNKLQPPPPPEPECEPPPDEENDAPKEFPLKLGSLYRITASEWYLRAVDPSSKQTVLINLNDIQRIKFVEKEVEVEKKEEKDKPKQSFKEFEWTPMIAYSAFPRNRGGHAMHRIGDYILLWGGCFLDYKCYDDLFLFNTRTKIWSNPRTFGTPPLGRTGFGSFVNGAKFYVFGGHTLQGLMNDLHEFDLESRSWNQLNWPGYPPTPRAHHKMVLTNIGGVIFGGYVGETYSNDIYVLDLINERWGKPSGGGEPPQGRESFGMIYHRGVIYVYGGYGVGVVLEDLYTLNEDLVWEKKDMFGVLPGPRQGIAMAEYDHRIFLTGGCNPKTNECFNDLLALDTKTNHLSSVSAFSRQNLRPVEYAGMVVAGPLLIHFGGCTLMKTCSDSLTAIKLHDPQACPPCRNGGVCRGGYCSCPQGFQGIDCNIRVFCKQNCLNQGYCLSNAQCKCFPGYTGSICQFMIPCPANCTDEEHGECQIDGKCKCNEGFSGDTCDSKKEDETGIQAECDCNGHGECNEETLLCACEEGFSGPDCSIIEGAQTSDEFKSIWELLKDDDDTPETGTSDVKLREFLATAYKFDQRQEGQVPIFDTDIEKVYFADDDIPDDQAKGSFEQVRQSERGDDDEGGLYEPQHRRHHSHNHRDQIENETLVWVNNQQLGEGKLGKVLTSVPPSRKQEEKDPFQLMPLDQCKKQCSKHGVCIERECFCWYGYTGEWCQASKIKDFYIGVRRKNVLLLCCGFFVLGTIAGYGIVMLMQKRGVQDEFKDVSNIQSGVVEDNEGEVEDKIL